MNKPHVHAEVIKAWADGETIQYWRSPYGWEDATSPTWSIEKQYRIKPEPKPDRVEYMTVYRNLHRRYEDERPFDEPIHVNFLADVRVTFCGNTGGVKAVELA